VTERRSYDAWGKRRNSNGTPMTSAFVTPDERHGFTGHEEWNEVGLIHMNGRLYDPATGRFLSADPTIQYADDMQNYNRYSYINNNPLSAVDFSGHGFLKKVAKTVGRAFKSVGKALKSVLKNPVVRMVGQVVSAAYGPWSAALFAAVSSYAQTGSLTAALTEGFKTYATAQAFGWAGGIENSVGGIAAHAFIGCASSVASGGRCGSGALSAGFTKAFSGTIDGLNDRAFRTMAAAIVGGTASVLGGGKFENGAVTGAFSRLFNDELHFNGKKLTYYDDDGNIIGEYSAVSGREGFQDGKYQMLKGKGPIPEGDNYWVKQEDIQFYDSIGFIDRVQSVIGRGTWPGAQSAWGYARVWISPSVGANTYGRGGFSIHGGSVPGSAGCLDLTKDIGRFINDFKSRGKGAQLKVDY
jgi:RHS repeat-associated protein